MKGGTATTLQAIAQRLMLTASGMTPPGLDPIKRLALERRMLDLLRF